MIPVLFSVIPVLFSVIPVLFSVQEVAKRLGGVSRWSVYTWMSQGRLKKTKVGSRVMVAESDLQAFISGCNPDPSAHNCAGHLCEQETIPARPTSRRRRHGR